MVKGNQKKVVSLILTLAMVLSLSVGVMISAGADGVTTINILHTNDIHGRFYQIENNNAGMIGIDKIAAIKNDTPNAILVDAGDAIHGLPIVNLSRGLNAVEMMTAAGYSVMAVGNHEFNYGSDRLLELSAVAKDGGLDMIAANVFVTETDELFLPATSIVVIDGISVGFFALSPQTTPIQTSPVNVATLEFRDYVEYAGAAIEALKEDGADIIIALAHITRASVEAVADAYGDDIAVIIEGHDHNEGDLLINGVLIAGANEYMTNLGVVSIDIGDDGSIVGKSASLMSKAEIDEAEIEGDPAVQALAEGIKEEVLAILDVVVANSEVHLSSARGDADTLGVRNSEQPLGNLVADAMRVMGEANVSILNGGGLRADVRVGEITGLDINAVLPFGNVLVVKEATPMDLKAIMEQGLRDAPGTVGHHPHISGMEVLYDSSRPQGHKVISISIDDIELDFDDDTTIYTIATNEFMHAGGDGYTALAALELVAEVDSLDSALTEYIITVLGGTITGDDAKIDGRMTDRAAASYEASPSAWGIVVDDGDTLETDMYSINGFNFLKIRDVAALLDGSDKQFNIDFDADTGTISLIYGQAYAARGDELTTAPNAVDTTTSISKNVFTVDDDIIFFEAYFIADSNYVRLRDVLALLDVFVDYDESLRIFYIVTTEAYVVN